jgi:hypothetical protein
VAAELGAGALVHQRGQAVIGRRADQDRGRARLVGVLGDQPARRAVVGRVQQHVALGGNAAGGEPVQVVADHGASRFEGLAVDPAVAGDGALLGVHHVDHPVVVGGEPGSRVRDQVGGR